MATKSSNPVLKRLAQAANEAGNRYLADQEQRQGATNILRPEEVGGDYDAGRLLTTTLGGSFRQLTSEDLITFKRNAEALGKRYKGGITPKAVIDRSRPIDRDRANSEIRVAIPHQTKGSVVHFITNAGPKSEVTRHHVLVEFLNLDAATASPASAKEVVKMIVSGAVKFDCDCGRHRYWYRYIATVGRFNAGRAETGFPKIRNPELAGVACKHVLRTMQVLGTPLIKNYVEKMVERARGTFDKKLVKTTAKDARDLAAHQARQSGWKRSTVESSTEKRERLAAQRAIKATAERSNAAMKKVAPAKLELMKKKFAADARRLAAAGALTPKQLAAMLAKLN